MKHDRKPEDRQGERPSDTEWLAGETAASEPLTDDERVQPSESESREERERHPNPPHTTTGKITSPKFGSATSGGGELDIGYEKN